MTARPRVWLIPAFVVGPLTVASFGIGLWQLLSGKQIEAASWVMAAGGLGLIVFSSVQLYREAHREDERLAAARAKLKPAARLARRMCDQAVIESNGKFLNEWLARWYLSAKARYEYVKAGWTGDRLGPMDTEVPSDRPDPIDRLEELLRETVTLAAETGGLEVEAADAALDAFILAANIINAITPKLTRSLSTWPVPPQGRQAVQHLEAAARALLPLAPRGDEEPALPSNPKFEGE